MVRLVVKTCPDCGCRFKRAANAQRCIPCAEKRSALLAKENYQYWSGSGHPSIHPADARPAKPSGPPPERRHRPTGGSGLKGPWEA